LAWGTGLIIAFNYKLAKSRNENPVLVIYEHLFIAAIVVVITFLLGNFISIYFG